MNRIKIWASLACAVTLAISVFALGTIEAAPVGADSPTTSPNQVPASTPQSVPALPTASQPYTSTRIVNGVSITTNVLPSTVEPMNTQINGSTTSPQPATCTWSTMFGTFLGAAYGKIKLNNGYCNTNPLSALSNVTAFTLSTTGPTAFSTSFGNWFQSTINGQTDAGEVFTICIEDPVGQTKSYYCSQYTYT